MNLSPEIIKMREALLERIGNKSLKEVAQIVNEILLNETDSTNRLAALAARVKVLRNYINKNYDIKNKSKKSELNNIKENNQPTKEAADNTDKNEHEKWVRVEMLKSGVVNGVRFPEGVVIDVNENGLYFIEEDGNFVQVSLGFIEDRFSKIIITNPQIEIIVRGDQDTSYQSIATLSLLKLGLCSPLCTASINFVTS